MTDILLVGASGRLGNKLTAALGDRVQTLYRGDVDVTCSTAVRNAIRDFKPRILINCTAFNDIEAARERPDLAFAVNTQAVAVMATAAWYTGSLFIHFSSDYAAAGLSPAPAAGPYGVSKALGEQAIAVIRPNYITLRLSSIYTSDDMAGALSAIMQWCAGAGRDVDNPIRVLRQLTTPTSIRTIVDTVTHIIAHHDRFGEDYCETYNLVDDSPISKKQFAKTALKLFLGVDSAIFAEGQLPVPRPTHSVLCNRSLRARFGIELPSVVSDLVTEAELWHKSKACPASATTALSS